MSFSGNSEPITQSSFGSEILYIPIESNVNIFKGSAVFVRSGKAVNGLAEGDLFAGVCKETVKNGSRPYVAVDTKGIFAFKYSGSPKFGDLAYIDSSEDNATITTTAPVTGLSVCVGVVINLENGFAFVRIDNSVFVNTEDVTPEVVIHVTGVTLNNKTKTLEVGGTYELVATVSPNDATDTSIRWQSNNTDIVTCVDGLITGISAGKASVVVTTIDGHYTAQCMVTVNEPTPVENNEVEGE